MKNVLCIASLLVLAFVGSSWAAELNSAFFEYKYECDVLPSALGATTTADFSTDGDILSMMVDADWENMVLDGSTGLNGSNNITLEWRMKGGPTGSWSSWDFYIAGMFDSGVGFFDVIRFNAGQYWQVDCGDNGWQGAIYASNDWTQWHTYRVALSAVGTELRTSFYIDDSLAGYKINNVKLETAPKDKLGFWSNCPGTHQFDYIRWTSQGAFQPGVVPEPMTLALLGLGGLGLIRRRR